MQQKPPRILILNRTFPPLFGATGRLAYELAIYLSKQGHSVTIVTTSPKPKTEQLQNKLTIIRVKGDEKPSGAWEYYKTLKRMEKAAKKLDHHDIVISMTDPPMLADVGQRVANHLKAKHVHWLMDLYPDLFPVLGIQIPKLAMMYLRNKIYGAMKSADAIIPISECMARYITYKGIPRQKLTIVQNWPEHSLLKKEKDQEEKKNEKFRILYAGTMGLGHDFSSIIKAASYFQKHAPEIEFVFIGKGGGHQTLLHHVKKRNLSNIHFLPHQPTTKLRSIMESGDIHLVTMKNDAAGLLYPSKFYSACVVGRPVIFIGPKECHWHKEIKEKQCGFSIRNKDFQNLIKAIQHYRHNAETWFSHAENSKKIIEGAPQNNLRSILTVLRNLS